MSKPSTTNPLANQLAPQTAIARRFLSIALPHLATDRIERRSGLAPAERHVQNNGSQDLCTWIGRQTDRNGLPRDSRSGRLEKAADHCGLMGGL